MRLAILSASILLMASLGGESNPQNSRILWQSKSAGPLERIDPPAARDDHPVIDRFDAMPDCARPDPRRPILSYHVSNGILHVRLDAEHRDGHLRTFHTQASSPGLPDSAMGATGVADPRAAPDVVAYVLVVLGRHGLETRQRLPFRYRVAYFELLGRGHHARAEGPATYTRYEVVVYATEFDSLTCSFRFDVPIRGEAGRAGRAGIFTAPPPGFVGPVPLLPWLYCEIEWHDLRKAQAAGTVNWIARVTDPCTQGIIIQSRHVVQIK